MGARGDGAERPAAEAGSAYIVALLVLVVLTIIGLALTLVTQTEVAAGANERSINRSFYATDSGLNVATQATLNSQNQTNLTFLLNTTGQDLGTPSTPALFADQVTVSPLTQINVQPCQLCDVSAKDKYYYITHVATSSTVRTGYDGSNQIPIAEKTVVAMIGLEPARASVEKELSGASQQNRAHASF